MDLQLRLIEISKRNVINGSDDTAELILRRASRQIIGLIAYTGDNSTTPSSHVNADELEVKLLSQSISATIQMMSDLLSWIQCVGAD